MSAASSLAPIPSLAALEERYLLFHLRGTTGIQRRTLPLTVGAGGECDVIVNTASTSAIAYILYSDATGRLLCYNVKSLSHEPTVAVRAFGLNVIGSSRGNAPTRVGLIGSFGELLQREAAWFDGWEKLSPQLKRLLGQGLSQSLRLTYWGLVILTLTLVLIWVNGAPRHPDLSKTPLLLTFASPRLEIIGASSVRHGYERGAILRFDVPKNAVTQSALLSFKTMALNVPNELTLRLNGKDVYTSNVDPACIASECLKQVPIPQGILKQGVNELHIEHNVAGGSYMMQAILIEPLPMMTLEERELVDRWTQLARRFYDERGIVSDNLLAARIHGEKALDLLGRRAKSPETDERLATARVLKQEIDAELERAIKDAWADVGVNERLGRPEEMTRALGILLRLYPDPSSREHQTIKAKIEALKEQQP